MPSYVTRVTYIEEAFDGHLACNSSSWSVDRDFSDELEEGLWLRRPIVTETSAEPSEDRRWGEGSVDQGVRSSSVAMMLRARDCCGAPSANFKPEVG